VKNSKKHTKARRATSRKLGFYRHMAEAMDPDYVPPPPVHDALQNDPHFRTALRQRGAIVEKRDGKFVVASPARQPIKGS
jgi:hypothetical protein